MNIYTISYVRQKKLVCYSVIKGKCDIMQLCIATFCLKNKLSTELLLLCVPELTNGWCNSTQTSVKKLWGNCFNCGTVKSSSNHSNILLPLPVSFAVYVCGVKIRDN